VTISDFPLGPQFALQRPYIKGVGFWGPIGSTKVTHSDGYEIIWPAPYNLGVRAVIKPEFLNWSSNTYTPDWIYSAYYAYFLAAPTTHYTYLPFTTFVHANNTYGNWYLTNHLDFFGEFYSFDLPPAPPSFWFQLPPS